jgi:hypothetical protein
MRAILGPTTFMIFADVLNVLALLLPIVIALLGIVVAIEETKATTKTQKILWRAGLLCLGLITTAIIVVQQNVAANDAQQLEKTNIQLAIKPLNTRIDKLIATINVLANKPFAESKRWPALFEHRFAFYKWKLCRVVG